MAAQDLHGQPGAAAAPKHEILVGKIYGENHGKNRGNHWINLAKDEFGFGRVFVGGAELLWSNVTKVWCA